jgi:CheY-like chemotaxis protein
VSTTSDGSALANVRDILLVDDSESESLLARAALRKSGARFQLSTVSNGRDAISWLCARKARGEGLGPILVLLDMRMPDWDGLRTLDEIRRHPIIGKTPVVFLTSLETPDVEPLYEAGVNAYVVKPASLPGLVKFFADRHGFWYDHITQGEIFGAEMPSA